MSQDNTTSWIIGGAAAGVGAWVLYRMANNQPILPGAQLNNAIIPVSSSQSAQTSSTAQKSTSATTTATSNSSSGPHLYNGALFQLQGSTKVYLYRTSDQKLHYICSYATFTSMNLSARSIQTVSSFPAAMGSEICNTSSSSGSGSTGTLDVHLSTTTTSPSHTTTSTSSSSTTSGCPSGYFRLSSIDATNNTNYVCAHAAPSTFPGNKTKGTACTTWVGLGPALDIKTHQPISGLYVAAKYQNNQLVSIYTQSSPVSLNSIYYGTNCSTLYNLL